jgi:ATP-dependent DNA helicase RecG
VGKERIQTMVQETSGFAISEKDLQLRGPGEIDGIRQSGAADLKIADIIKDVELMAVTRKAAIEILQEDSNLENVSNQSLKNYLLSRKEKEIWSRIS